MKTINKMINFVKSKLGINDKNKERYIALKTLFMKDKTLFNNRISSMSKDELTVILEFVDSKSEGQKQIQYFDLYIKNEINNKIRYNELNLKYENYLPFFTNMYKFNRMEFELELAKISNEAAKDLIDFINLRKNILTDEDSKTKEARLLTILENRLIKLEEAEKCFMEVEELDIKIDQKPIEINENNDFIPISGKAQFLKFSYITMELVNLYEKNRDDFIELINAYDQGVINQIINQIDYLRFEQGYNSRNFLVVYHELWKRMLQFEKEEAFIKTKTA